PWTAARSTCGRCPNAEREGGVLRVHRTRADFQRICPTCSLDGGQEPKKAGTRRAPALPGWWRWRELNPRPKALHPRYYMLSPPLDLVPEQHGARSASRDQPVSSTGADRRPSRLDSRNNDPTSTSTGTSGFGAYALSGESVVVVVGN